MSAPAARRNPHTGRDCPDWCATDHDGVDACVGSGTTGTFPAPVFARAVLAPHHAGLPVVAVTGLGDGDTYQIELRPRQALQLAALLELLADAGPDEVRGLAAGIRRAAADTAGQRA